MGAVAEFERAMIRERQAEGIAQAKKRGAYKGRKRSLSPAQVAELQTRLAAGENKSGIATALNISRETVYAYLRREKAEAEVAAKDLLYTD
jgi:DNA invertase Pin-like site-specific DNA recombinase